MIHEHGFDIINLVQINAAGMGPVNLKKVWERPGFLGRRYRHAKSAPYGNPEKVREETLRLCQIFSKDGGFVLNTVHNIQANVPIENIVAMFDALKELNGN